MKRILYSILLIITPTLLFAQGINFRDITSWNDLINQAKQSNKFIFIDVYATWCGPCKAMDANVYNTEDVGKVANEKYIAIKLQADQTANDNQEVLKARPFTDSITKMFHVDAYPTLLFLSPEGNLIAKEEGFRDAAIFVRLLDSATKTKEGYQAEIDRYNERKLTFAEMPSLVSEATKIGDDQMAKKIAKDYNDNYLLKQSPSQLLTKENLETIIYNVGITKSSDPYFKIIYNNQRMVDSLMNRQVAGSIVEWIINHEEIDSVINTPPTNLHPDWQTISTNITTKYDKRYADKLIPPAKLAFFQKNGQWKAYAKLFDEQLAKKSISQHSGFLGDNFGDAWALNGVAWNTFSYCNDKDVLKRALNWIDLALSTIEAPVDSDQYLDTKANILYKLGQKQLAMATEEKAMQIDSQYAKGWLMEGYNANLAKMKKDEPTWQVSK